MPIAAAMKSGVVFQMFFMISPAGLAFTIAEISQIAECVVDHRW
jgi:hypothetical protein